ncbi:nucleoside monophosphate kinase [Vallitalea okinawensis]|uniref:nucleoside monophosphate kinase n=1 Tax=Vallitalea okinawensis TaxID=2078660 RepID=UPI000CFB7599|nr:nucleoside monophosphate kinase [Vallitalea okinawensis]
MQSRDIQSGEVKITVKKVHVQGRGAIVLTGPSSCGKGEIAKALQNILSIPNERHLSMGSILRMTIDRARNDQAFKEKLSADYGISYRKSIFDLSLNKREHVLKAEKYKKELDDYCVKEMISQLDWLEFCVVKGLLIPDLWTIKLIDAIFESSPELQDNIFILDGYPRTSVAAEKLLGTFLRYQIPLIKVIHLSITKEEMKKRAFERKRVDDDDESLERRYEFYIEKVHPSVDYMKIRLGSSRVALIDAHQPIYDQFDKLDIDKSIQQVALKVLHELGLPSYLLDLK